MKKAFLVFIVFFTIISLFIYFIGKSAPKQTDQLKETRKEIYKVINDPKLNSTEEGKAQISTYRNFLCPMIGEACTDNPEDGNKNFDSSIMGFMSNLIVMPFANPVSSGVYWVRDGLQNAGFVPKTYAAQGIGYSALAPFKSIWLMFRNFVFMIMVLVIVAIGFMIMFRMKLNPQTVISIESALPKIVIALILITFSYPIVGFMIDLMYVTIGFVITIFGTNPALHTSIPDLFNKYFFGGTGNLWEDFTPLDGNRDSYLWTASQTIYDILPDIFKNIISGVVTVLGWKLATMFFNSKLGEIKFAGIGKSTAAIKMLDSFQKVDTVQRLMNSVSQSGLIGLSTVTGIFFVVVEFLFLNFLASKLAVFIITLILGLSLIFIFFRIFFMLLSSYLNILFMVIFSPLIIAIEAIPGKSTFSAWIKSLISHLMTFPIVIALVLITKIILDTGTTGNVLWQPPYFFGLDPTAFKSIVAVGILFMIPDLIKVFRELLGFKPFPLSFGIGSLFTGAQATGGGAMGIVGQISSLNLAAQAFGIQQPLGKIFGKVGNTIRTDVGGIMGRTGNKGTNTDQAQPGHS